MTAPVADLITIEEAAHRLGFAAVDPTLQRLRRAGLPVGHLPGVSKNRAFTFWSAVEEWLRCHSGPPTVWRRRSAGVSVDEKNIGFDSPMRFL